MCSRHFAPYNVARMERIGEQNRKGMGKIYVGPSGRGGYVKDVATKGRAPDAFLERMELGEFKDEQGSVGPAYQVNLEHLTSEDLLSFGISQLKVG